MANNEPLLRTLKLWQWISRDAIDDSLTRPIPRMAADLVESAYARAASTGADIVDWRITFAPHTPTTHEELRSSPEHLAWLAAGYDMALRARVVGGAKDEVFIEVTQVSDAPEHWQWACRGCGTSGNITPRMWPTPVGTWHTCPDTGPEDE